MHVYINLTKIKIHLNPMQYLGYEEEKVIEHFQYNIINANLKMVHRI